MDSHPSVRAGGATLVVLTFATMGCADVLPTAGGAAPIHVAAAPFQMRSYYIAADTVDWDFAANQAVNPISGAPYTSEESIFAVPSPRHIGNVYKKALYREYTDATFTTLKPRPASGPIWARWVHS